MKNLFIHLRLHSNFSLAEGMLSFDDLSNFCVKNNQPAIAITDTNNLFGALEFSLKMISCGIQPIIGIQINISQNGKLIKSQDRRKVLGNFQKTYFQISPKLLPLLMEVASQLKKI